MITVSDYIEVVAENDPEYPASATITDMVVRDKVTGVVFILNRVLSLREK